MDRADNEPIPAAVATGGPDEAGWRRLLATARSHQGIAVGAVIVAAVVLVAALAPVISPFDPNEIHPIDRLKGIGTPGYLLGTDIQGRDMLSRLAWGSRTSLAIAVVPLAIAGLVGLLLGSFAAYGGGVPETLIMRGMDVSSVFLRSCSRSRWPRRSGPDWSTSSSASPSFSSRP